ncbi:MAG: DUF1735 domain-containing protein, partial [Capnocytophaga sp.]|nr:DUF1735 domain-containing protein [Capnocytophaga sp.]
MKNITKILYSIACAGAMFSCSQDEFSIEKNTTLEWDIDETIKNADIRTRIGYDPRLTYVYFPTEATDVSM